MTNITKILWAIAISLILINSIYFSLKLKFPQLKFINIFKSLQKEEKNDKISAKDTLIMALSSKIGVGSLAGVAISIYYGGLGTIFWIWISTFFLSIITYIENSLSILYKEKDGKYQKSGPSYYIKKGLNNKKLSIIYAIIILITYTFVFSSIQNNTIVTLTTEIYNINQIIISLIITFLAGIIILKGIKTISNICNKIFPVMIIIFVILGLIVLMTNLPETGILLKNIIMEAFNEKAVSGGIIYTIILALQKSVFAGESGTGTSAIIAGTTDNAGNVSTVKSTNIKIDKTLPTVTLSSTSGGAWTNEKIIVTVTATDSSSGIKSIEYSYDNKTWTTASSSNFDTNTTTKKVWTPEYTANQNRTLYVRTTDNAGNVSTVKSTNIKIDTTGPTVTLSNPSRGEWTNQKVIITATLSDSSSGIKNVQYSYNNSSWTTVSSSNFDTNTTTKKVWTPEYTAERNQTLYVRATDNAGNISAVKSTNIKIDTTDPYLYDRYYWKHDYTSNNNLCYIYIYHFRDALSGVYRLKYGHCYQNYNCSSGSAYTRMTQKSYELRNWDDGGHKQINYCMPSGYTANIYFSVCDKAGNCKEFGTYTEKF